MQPNSKKSSSLERLRNVFSHFTLLLTVGFGFVTTLTLIEEPSRTLQPTFVTATSRGPASITASTVLPSKPFMSTLSIDCESKAPLKTQSEHIRLKSHSCGADLSNEIMVVKNTRNGFAATVFHQGSESFTTDYLTLLQGENRILIENGLKDGHIKTREVIIHRE